ncbi:uncharacterized protein ACBT57_019498 [Dama dama]
MPHPERCPPSREPRPPPQGGGGDNLHRGDPSLFPPPQRPAKGPEEAGEGGSQAKKEGGAAKVDWSPAPRATGGARRGPASKEQAGGLRTQEQRRRFPQGCGEEEARIRLVGAGGGVPSPGSGRRRRGPAGAHPTISRLAAGCPLSPGRRPGRSFRTSRSGRGASRRRIPPDTLRPGRLQKGEEGAAGRVCGRGGRTYRPHPGRRRAARSRGRVPRRGGRARRPAAGPPPDGAHQQLRGPAPHARQRGAARGAAEALTPPAPSAAAAARTGGARGRRRRSSPWRFLQAAGFPEGQSGDGAGLPRGVPGLRGCVGLCNLRTKVVAPATLKGRTVPEEEESGRTPQQTSTARAYLQKVSRSLFSGASH